MVASPAEEIVPALSMAAPVPLTVPALLMAMPPVEVMLPPAFQIPVYDALPPIVDPAPLTMTLPVPVFRSSPDCSLRIPASDPVIVPWLSIVLLAVVFEIVPLVKMPSPVSAPASVPIVPVLKIVAAPLEVSVAFGALTTE